MEAKLIRERVAQYIKDRRFLDLYECPICGSHVVKPRRNAVNGPRCGPCRSITHGMKGHPAYRIWLGIVRRCGSPSHVSYHNYGGRGIRLCDEWKDVRVFCEWAMANGFRDGLEIDRIDVNGNYCPENCRFVTRQENTQNKRSTKLDPDKVRLIRSLVSSGQTMASVARRLGVSPVTVHGVVNGLRWANVK